MEEIKCRRSTRYIAKKLKKMKNVREKAAYFSNIDKGLCKGHVSFSHTYIEDDCISKCFKMKGKYVLSFLSLLYSSDQYSDEYIIMLPVDYVNRLHDNDVYLVSIDVYDVCAYTNIYNVTKRRVAKHLSLNKIDK